MPDVSLININNTDINIKDATARKAVTDEVTARKAADANYKGENKTATVTGDYTVTAGDLTETADNIIIHGTKSVLIDSDGTYTEDITGKRKITSNDNEEIYSGTHSEHVTGAVTKAYDNNVTVSVDGTYSSVITGQITETHKASRTVTGTNDAETMTGIKSISARDIRLTPTNDNGAITYSKPTKDGKLVTVPYKDTDGNVYKVLCEGSELGDVDIQTPIYLAVFHDQTTGAAMFYVTIDGVTYNSIDLGEVLGRDGSLAYIDGVFYLAVTYYSTGRHFTIYTSDDLLTWTEHAIYIDGLSKSVVWAPDLYVADSTLYAAFSAADSMNGPFSGYTAVCTDLSTLNFSNLNTLTYLPDNVIDLHFFDYRGTQYLSCKDENEKTIKIYTGGALVSTVPFPIGVEAPATMVIDNMLYITADYYLAPEEKTAGTQSIIVTRTSDFSNYDLCMECNFGLPPRKVLGIRHGGLLKLSRDAATKLYAANNDVVQNSSPYHSNGLPEHLNIEDIGKTANNTTIVDVAPIYPRRLWCIFDNPTGVTTPTTAVTVNAWSCPFDLDDFYVYVESGVAKTFTFPSRQTQLTLTLDGRNAYRMLHFHRGIDNLFALVEYTPYT